MLPQAKSAVMAIPDRPPYSKARVTSAAAISHPKAMPIATKPARSHVPVSCVRQGYAR